MSSINPTRGRSLLYFMACATAGFAGNGGESFAAILADVNKDTGRLSLGVFDANGVLHPRTDVRLVQDGEDVPSGDYAHWMPFQQKQPGVMAQILDDIETLRNRVHALENVAPQEAPPETPQPDPAQAPAPAPEAAVQSAQPLRMPLEGESCTFFQRVSAEDATVMAYPAKVTKVWSDTCVNLSYDAGISAEHPLGDVREATSVLVLRPGMEQPAGYYCVLAEPSTEA